MLVLLITSIVIGLIVGSLTFGFIGLAVGIWFFIINIPLALKMSYFDSKVDQIIHSSERNAMSIREAISERSFEGKSYDIKHFDNRQIHFHGNSVKKSGTRKSIAKSK